MLNVGVDPDLLRSLVPRGCALDLFDGIAFVSVVGFQFVDTRVWGIGVPFHRTFDEVNLRFYVRRTAQGEERRGVTFIREFVPRRAIAMLARWIYNEPYRAVPLSSTHDDAVPNGVPKRTRYRAGPIDLSIETQGVPRAPDPGSVEAFISEHYWGYTTQRDGGTLEYRVTHPPWRVAPATEASLRGDLSAAYGREFERALSAPPHSAWVADGSPVVVYRPTRLRFERPHAT